MPKAEMELLKFLFQSLPELNRTRIKQLLKYQCVSVGGKITTQFNHIVRPGEEVRIVSQKARPITPAARFNLEIVYEDDQVIVIHKPAGLLTVGSEKVRRETAIFALNDYLNKKTAAKTRQPPKYRKQVFVVHRLDRDVSGLLLFAKDEKSKLILQRNWDQFRKEYVAVVEGHLREKKGTCDSYLTENQFLKVFSGPRNAEAKRAVTHYEVLESGKKTDLLKIRLETGRKHQIRVHLADLKHPIVGDKLYGALTNPLKRIALHAYRLEFTHPLTRKRMEFSLPILPAFQALLSQ